MKFVVFRRYADSEKLLPKTKGGIFINSYFVYLISYLLYLFNYICLFAYCYCYCSSYNLFLYLNAPPPGSQLSYIPPALRLPSVMPCRRYAILCAWNIFKYKQHIPNYGQISSFLHETRRFYIKDTISAKYFPKDACQLRKIDLFPAPYWPISPKYT